MHARLLALTAATALAAAATAQMQAPGKPDPKAAQPGTYQVEPGHTQVRFGVLHMGFNPYFGTFSNASGTLMLDPGKPGATKVSIEVPISSVQTTSDKLTDELKSKMFFDAAQFPTMKFESTKVTVNGTKAAIAGNLTMHGVTKPVTLNASFVGAGAASGKQQVGFTATGSVKRSDFGINFGIGMLSDAVDINITAAFQKG